MIASYDWWKFNTVILRECYHDTMQILLYYGNIMNMFQQKSLKLQCKKNNQWEGRNDKTPFLKGFSDLRLLINTCEGLSFQWSCRQNHAAHQNMKSLSLIYIYLKNINTFIVFFTNIHMPKQTMPVFLCQ